MDRLSDADDLVEFRRELLDSSRVLLRRDAAKAGAERGATGRRRCQHVPAREAKSHGDPPVLCCAMAYYSAGRVAVSGAFARCADRRS
jgi:hypothetical protein